MGLNPILDAERIVRSFLKYQLSASPFSDDRLHERKRELISVDRARHMPLLRGPYISWSRAFAEGASIAALIDQKVLHPHMRQIIPS